MYLCARACVCVRRRAALFRAYVQEKSAWRASLAASRQREADALARADGAQAKADRLEELSATLSAVSSGDAAASMAQLKALTRQLSALEVVQPILARRYNLLQTEFAAAREAARTAEVAAVECEAHLRQRILYLELWKKGAEVRRARSRPAPTACTPPLCTRVLLCVRVRVCLCACAEPLVAVDADGGELGSG